MSENGEPESDTGEQAAEVEALSSDGASYRTLVVDKSGESSDDSE